MKVKFNKFERVAGLFVLSTILGGLALIAVIAIKQGWFETRVRFQTTLTNADGIHAGTLVQMAGLRAGAVTEVELRSGNEVHVSFEISEKFYDLVREDSVVRMIRPFVISEKVVDVSVGTLKLPQAKPETELKSVQTADIMDFISGKTLAPYFDTMGKMVENLRIVAEAILDPERSKDIIRIFDELRPLTQNMNNMAKQVGDLLHDSNKNKQLVRTMNNLAQMTTELNKLLPEMNKMVPMLEGVAKDSPKLTADMSKIASNLAVLTDELSSTLPAIKETLHEVGPEVPRAARRAMEALDETVVTLKALQRSFILRSNAKEVREEEAERERARRPASQAPDAGTDNEKKKD